MYGTRDAAQNWEEEYSSFLLESGFRRGKASPCVFFHKERNLHLVVHGDDFTNSRPKDALDCLEQVIIEEYEISVGPR